MNNHISDDELLGLIKNMDLEETALEKAEVRAAGDSAPSGEGAAVSVENNQILVREIKGGAYPVVEALPPVQLFKNGQLVEGKTRVGAGDKLEWQIAREPLYRIEVAENKLEAYFQLLSKVRHGWNLLDRQADAHLVIEAVEDKNVVLETVNLSEVMKTLQSMAIVKNIRSSVIFQELANPTHERRIVAKGVRPEPSQDARLELYFSQEVQSSIDEQDRNKAVDYRNHLHIPSVKGGDLIARKFPMVPGVIGYTVYGEVIEPVPPTDITVIAKENVEIRGDGEVYAMKDGRPRVTGTHPVRYFDIATAYVVNGDVDLKTGNIAFSGDVIVHGSVKEGMMIESLGNVYIFGNAYQATVTATGSIQATGNIVKSHFYSGYYGVLFNRLYINCKALNEVLAHLIQASQLLMSVIESKGQIVRIGQVLMTLIESKFKEIPKTAADTLACVKSIQRLASKEMNELRDQITLLTDPRRILALDSFNLIYAIQNIVRETYDMVERMQEIGADIDVGQCYLSEAKATGDILIRKEGVLQSSLYSKGSITFFGRDAVCRGSQLDAQDTITAHVVGGDFGGETMLKAGRRITMHRMNPGKLCIGKLCRQILQPIKQVNAYVQDDELVLEFEK
ncbi:MULTISPECIES: FapA family protein [Paenibacillus]|uniref:FapA family protein n=1 Tax=Paenibacillus TaxID=44249 RepID=UPI0022B928A4|nr:FapA family protein [Paenibacillus caseinilyticus]MCZ8523656.1 FapA family protein [Paenibacillus caseinilyticus]